MSLQHFGKGALRVAKNYTKGYSDTQAKVRDATSNDPWGPSGTQMNEIAQLSYNQCVPFIPRVRIACIVRSAVRRRALFLLFHTGMTLSKLWRCLISD